MRATVAARWMHKGSNTPTEYEDAWSVEPAAAVTHPLATGPVRVAVCDGASEGFLARRWACALTAALVAAPVSALEGVEDFVATVASAAAGWPLEVKSYIAEREAQSRPLRWNERASLARGSAATLLAFHASWQPTPRRALVRKLLFPSRCQSFGWWCAVAVGDTCVFQVGGDKLKSAFPLTGYAEFDITPPLLSTDSSRYELTASRVRLITGSFAEGDAFYLCTDALAAWFLEQHALGRRPWKVLNGLDATDFEPWLLTTREARLIRDDDVTLIRIAFGDHHADALSR